MEDITFVMLSLVINTTDKGVETREKTAQRFVSLESEIKASYWPVSESN